MDVEKSFSLFQRPFFVDTVLGPVDISLTAALAPVFICGKAGGERFGYSK
ncbi:hypothetical protein HXW73_07085 [Halomonas sp. SH5A2]|nr:hypothetical protein [Halomonas sp. SH5A2]QNI02717.1 hypothetical protein HXW73_07085 [Halomonas sp. SH5A2]